MRKELNFHVLLTPDQKDRWSLVAKENEVSLAELMRRSVESFISGRAGMTKNEIDAVWELTDQMRRIGVNVNELLIQLHLTKIPADIENQLREFVKEIRPLIDEARRKIHHGQS